MELKDILPFLDPEVLKRWTEYQSKLDWSMMEKGKRYTIETLSDFIRNKGFGGDVRESIAQAIEWINDLTDKQILNEKQTQILTDSLKAKYKELEDRYDAQIGALTEDSEVIDARGGKTTLGQRLDEADEHLSQIAVPVTKYGAIGDGIADDTQAFIDCANNERNWYIPDGTYNLKLTEPLKIGTSKVRGTNRHNTKIRNSTNVPVFWVGWETILTDLEFIVPYNNTVPTVVAGNYDGAFRMCSYSIVKRLKFTSTNPTLINTWTGVEINIKASDDSPDVGAGAWGLEYKDLFIYNCGKGFTAQLVNKGWFTSSSFDNVYVAGFNGDYAVFIGETADTPELGKKQIQLSYLNATNFSVQVQDNIKTNSSAFLLGGKHMNYKNFTVMYDAPTDNTMKGLRLHHDPNIPIEYKFSATNSFENFNIERGMDLGDFKYSNFFKNVKDVTWGVDDGVLNIDHVTNVLPSYNKRLAGVLYHETKSTPEWNFNDDNIVPKTVGNRELTIYLPPYLRERIYNHSDTKHVTFMLKLKANERVGLDKAIFSKSVIEPTDDVIVHQDFLQNSPTEFTMIGIVKLNGKSGKFALTAYFNSISGLSIEDIYLIPEANYCRMPMKHDSDLITNSHYVETSILTGNIFNDVVLDDIVTINGRSLQQYNILGTKRLETGGVTLNTAVLGGNTVRVQAPTNVSSTVKALVEYKIY